MTYARLHESAHKLGELQNAIAMLMWDEAVMMPAGSGDGRGETLATLAGMAHDLSSDPAIEDWIEASRDESLDAWQRANVREIHRSFVASKAVPKDLVVAISKATSRTEQRWRTARAENDWPAIEPLLSK